MGEAFWPELGEIKGTSTEPKSLRSSTLPEKRSLAVFLVSERKRLLLIQGKTNADVLDTFPGRNRPEVVHRDHLAPLQTNLDQDTLARFVSLGETASVYDYEDEEEDMFGSPPPVNARTEIDFKSELNDDQFQAVTALTIHPRLGWRGFRQNPVDLPGGLSADSRRKPEAILLLTFTNKASSKCSTGSRNLRCRAHRFSGGTFHSVGGQILRLFSDSVGLAKNFTILDDGDSDSLLNEIIRELDPGFFKSKENPKAKPIKGLISYARSVMEPVEKWCQNSIHPMASSWRK